MRCVVDLECRSVKLWVSASETEDWARRPGSSWPCSTLSGKRLFAEFTLDGDLVDLAVNGRDWDGDAAEFHALTVDFLQASGKLRTDFPLFQPLGDRHGS